MDTTTRSRTSSVASTSARDVAVRDAMQSTQRGRSKITAATRWRRASLSIRRPGEWHVRPHVRNPRTVASRDEAGSIRTTIVALLCARHRPLSSPSDPLVPVFAAIARKR